MTVLCMVRHGQTDWNAEGKLQGSTDIPLNSNGIKQAELCAAYLKQEEWDIIISSPLSRAKRTAEIIQNQVEVPLIVMEDFIERHFGKAEGMTPAERKEHFPDQQYTNMETVEELTTRLQHGLMKINRKYSNQKVLLVAHGAVIHAILAANALDAEPLNHIRLENACLNNMVFHEDKWSIKEYNIIDHLHESEEVK
ncbi:histidine phosphatase family protein [Cytobacillus gottheilii]|uniref:histidine phosphatase family protein n=1 Tax=Cytobacillus gottheilii TaxID=859144 RepID=UPI0009BC0168|nr:histidine phosphatase family protein [Cytobacillus gottheilii]